MRHTRDVFRIRKVQRTYNRTKNQFNFNISYQTHVEPTPRTLVVAEAFGLGIDDTQKFPILNTELTITPYDVVLITGDSGSGKSVLLRAIKEDLGPEAADMTDVQVDPEKPIIESIGATVETALELLSKVGLNDAFLFLRSYKQLSDGQKYRFKLAKLIESGKQWWLMDEFGALLDRETAKIIAFNMQKVARQQGKAVIAATTHGDLQQDLAPSVEIYKRFGDEITITYHPNQTQNQCSLLQDMQIEAGTVRDWQQLSQFHYRGHGTGARRAIYTIRHKGWIVGAIIYGYPSPTCGGRSLALPKMTLKQLNQQLSVIRRVVIHPKYRSIGLAEKLIKETLLKAGTPYIEMTAVMGKYNPFAERAGMKKITIHGPSKEVLKIAQTLTNLGFDQRLLASTKYNQTKIENLTPQQIITLKDAFKHNNNLRIIRELGAIKNDPYGAKKQWQKDIDNANTEQLIKLIKAESTLLQTKAYLFWRQPGAP